MNGLDHTLAFELHRRYLLGLAYRILGSRAEAETAPAAPCCATQVGWSRR